MTVSLFAIATALAASLFCAALAGYALHLSIKTQIELKAMQKSTHSVQLVPADVAAKWQSDDLALNKKIDEVDDTAARDLGFATSMGEI